jgi:hypothetical protein
MGFWDQAVDQAGREFGARFWRWFAAGRVLRRIAPGLSLVVLVVSAAAGAYLAYRWLQPDWAGVGRSLMDFAGAALWWVIGAAVLGVLAAVGAALWRAHGWKLRLRYRRF